MKREMKLPNPIIGGFNPDPSILKDGDNYYLVTSTFEYLPGIPIYHSTDLENWKLLSHVVTRTEQVKVETVPTGGGVWAPTIRKHNNLFYVVVTEAMGRGTLIFTTADPSHEWSDGILVDVRGIDPDIAWDENNDCYMTFSAFNPETGIHLGIQQVKINPVTGERFEEPRSIWSGTGLIFPEAPHLYKIDDYWYLMIAEGGTERGHCVSIARSKEIVGPFEGAPHNPILSARSTSREIQNTGHGDLFQAHDGNWYLVLLGMHIRGLTRSFASLGRESFITHVHWRDGWPHVDPVFPQGNANNRHYLKDFESSDISGELISVRRLPQKIAERSSSGLLIRGNGLTMDAKIPDFIGKRQEILFGTIELNATISGVAGLTLRYDENAHYDVEVTHAEIIARSRLAYGVLEERCARPDGLDRLKLFMRFVAPEFDYESAMTSDLIDLGFIDAEGNEQILARFDGRYLSAEVTCSFTGRVFGAYAVEGDLVIHSLEERPATNVS